MKASREIYNKDMNKALVILLVVVVVLVGGYFLFTNKRVAPTGDVNSDQGSGVNIPPLVGDAPAGGETPTQPQVKEFTVEASNFSFSVKEMKVKKGDTVKVVFKNTESMHDWVIDEFNAKTKQIKAGESETIEFVADKNGTFEYYCSVGTHRQMGMKGNLIVE